MLKVLRRLFGGGPSSGSARATRTARRSSATGRLAKRSGPLAEKSPSRAAGEVDFDPYNTGVFDRSASWERVGKRNL